MSPTFARVANGSALPTTDAQRLYSAAYTRTKMDVLIIFLLMVGSAVFAYLFLFNQSLRLDEAQSLWQTSRSPYTLLSIVAQDVHVPLYHIILHFWQVFFGNSVAVTRALSMVFFTLTIPAMYMLGKEAYGRKVGMFGAVLVAISPFLNWYGSEIRMYSMLVFLTVLNQYFFIRLMRKNSSSIWWGYALTALAGIFTHYFFFLSLFSQAIFFLSNRERFPENALRNFTRIIILWALAFLPWVIFVFHLGFASTTQPQLTKPTTYNLFATFEQFIFGFQDDHINSILISLWPISFLFAFFILRKDRRNGKRRGISPYSIYFLLSSLFTVVMVFFVSLVRPIYLSRYLILTIPSLYLLLGWIFATFPTPLARALRIFLVMAMVFTFANQTISAQTPVKEDYRDAVSYLSNHAGNQDVIVLSAPFTIYPVEYYYKGTTQLATLPSWDRYAHGGLPAFNAAKLPEQVQATNANHSIVWLLLSVDQGYNEPIRKYYETHFERIDHQLFSNGVELFAYRVKY